MSLAGEWTVLQMRMVTGEKPGPGRVFGNLRTPSSGSVLDATPFTDTRAGGGKLPARWRRYKRLRYVYSNTLSSSFFLPQSAAACTKARMMG